MALNVSNPRRTLLDVVRFLVKLHTTHAVMHHNRGPQTFEVLNVFECFKLQANLAGRGPVPGVPARHSRRGAPQPGAQQHRATAGGEGLQAVGF